MSERAGHASESPQDVWKENNEGFQYDAPEKPPEAWSTDEYQELHDRVIGRRTEWYCQHCSTSPFSSLEKARRHVSRQHGQQLVEKYAPAEEA
ncbi:hypothetical protein [Halorarum salinum]|uniref:Uncharacterized protein n=1 Tax=Halorarum salinum TaxID=2743089 RepID=A0A7D5LBW4_9EURY|nr:hypothetical protein [Halobaculum salinum]QLG62851.1 hypothetical protein HUG12_14385 [Halobaculum salinum]